MPSFKSVVEVMVIGLVAVTTALPAFPKISERSRARLEMAKRQTAAVAASSALSDVDILQLYVIHTLFREISYHIKLTDS